MVLSHHPSETCIISTNPNSATVPSKDHRGQYLRIIQQTNHLLLPLLEMPAYETFEANDGALLKYQSHGDKGKEALILLHGFTGSSQYFIRNFQALSKQYWVIAPDHRGHGSSAKTKHGYHVARLAMDLKNLLDHIRSIQPDCRFVGIGCSLGAAILWTYAELFDSTDFSGMVFVDQAPLQDYLPEENWTAEYGNYGCHDASSLAQARSTLVNEPNAFYRGLVEECLAYRLRPDAVSSVAKHESEADEAFFVGISQQGNPHWYAKLLANHTSYDHRDTLAYRVDTPCCIMAGKYSGCFPLAGMGASSDLINSRKPGLAKTLVVDSGHCPYPPRDPLDSCANFDTGMFYEESEKWSALVVDISQGFFTVVAST